MQNYHRHTSYSNIFTPDSAAVNEDYAKRAVELGHKVISSVEHGWQGNYFECYELAKKYDLKFIFGAEAYWVRNRIEEYPVIDSKTKQVIKNTDGKIRMAKDRSNNHIILLAKNENGRRAINNILSTANEDGYYYRPRLDLELLLSLPSNDIMVTTACIAFWHYKDIEDILTELKNHFQNNIFLEIQYHNTLPQIELNKRIARLSSELEMPMIVGLDSHFILPEQSSERDYILAAKGIHYEDEEGWMMDYPDDDTVLQRFLQQKVFNKKQIVAAMDQTDCILDFDGYDILSDGSSNNIFNQTIKLPTLYDGKHYIDGELYPELNQEQKNKLYSVLITKKFKEYTKDFSPEERDRYFQGIKDEVKTVKDTKMADYFLIDYQIVKKALEKGAVLTNTGRGSAVSFMTNTLLDFSKVDRFQSPIKLYPERFMSTTRILQSASLPDIDLNWGTPEIAEEAQKEIMGEDHVYPMIAFGTAKKKSAFKLYARSQSLDFDLANEISKQIEKYDEALKYADDDEKDDINIYDFVDEKYHSYIDASKKYWGIIMDKKKAPCAFLLYNGNIREEIGLIKCKSESTKKEYITTVIDGAIAENYKFLKNDILKIDCALLTDIVFKRIGMNTPTVEELKRMTANDSQTWDIYRKGLTIGVNQCEKPSTIQKVMKYKPHNISELSAFIAAIRPGFKSMYKKFENREEFSYGIPALDNLVQTKEMPVSFMIYQEQVMQVLNYAGFPIDQCYTIIKSIAKKHPEKVRPLKEQFLIGLTNKLITEEQMKKEEAEETSAKIWTIIDDNCQYSFNSSHAYCMGLDSLYQAWQKAHYPYEFYEVLLQVFSDKGKKDKVAELKKEMLRGFGILEGDYKFGSDNRKFSADKENHVIQPSLLSIKGLSQGTANDLYKLGLNKYDSFLDLWKAMKSKKSLNSGKIDILVEIGYFKDFAKIGKLQKFLQIIDKLYGRNQFNKNAISTDILSYVVKFSNKETDKQYREFDYESALKQIWDDLPDEDIPLKEKIQYELDNIGYIKTVMPDLSADYVFIQDYECKYKNPKLTLYRLCDGRDSVIKVKRPQYDKAPISKGDIIKILDISKEGKWSKDENGEWQQDNSNKELILKKWAFVLPD